MMFLSTTPDRERVEGHDVIPADSDDNDRESRPQNQA